MCFCGKVRPCFGYINDKKPTHCNQCKLPNMENIVTKKCKSNEEYNIPCPTWGNKKYNGYCTHCFANLFPNHPKTTQIRQKSKELQVVNYITTVYKEFIHDKPFYTDLEGGCCSTKRRIDLRKLIGNTMLCIEIDENQHKYYIHIDEKVRYDDLFMDFSGKYVFIRYNPDTYKENGVRKNPHFETRMKKLKDLIDIHTKRIQNEENKDIL
jgi:hypothetical protein